MATPHRLSPEEVSEKYSVSLPIVREAYANLDQEKSMILAFSGKIAAGKDSVAPIAAQMLNYSNSEIRTDSFGANLKQELNEIISELPSFSSPEIAADRIGSIYGVPRNEARKVIEFIYNEVNSGQLQRAEDRTLGSRAALQYWATEIRRSQDPLYWTKPVVQRLMEFSAQGISTRITDTRFFTEVWGVLDAGGGAIRLDVSPEEQRKRVFERDGIHLTDKARLHVSEIELDNFEHFSVRVQTDDYNSAESVALAAANGLNMVTATLF